MLSAFLLAIDSHYLPDEPQLALGTLQALSAVGRFSILGGPTALNPQPATISRCPPLADRHATSLALPAHRPPRLMRLRPSLLQSCASRRLTRRRSLLYLASWSSRCQITRWSSRSFAPRTRSPQATWRRASCAVDTLRSSRGSGAPGTTGSDGSRERAPWFDFTTDQQPAGTVQVARAGPGRWTLLVLPNWARVLLEHISNFVEASFHWHLRAASMEPVRQAYPYK